jgi:hypothetical protein
VRDDEHEAASRTESEPHSVETPPSTQKLEIPKLNTSIALWLILFVFGGGLLALYYAGIGYFPEVSWQDALTYMAMMTIIGGSLFVGYSFLLLVPGAIWSEYLISDERFEQILRLKTRKWEPCVWRVTVRIIFPFFLFMAFCHFLLYLQPENRGPAFVAIGAAASLFAVSGLLGRDIFKGLRSPLRKRTAAAPRSQATSSGSACSPQHHISLSCWPSSAARPSSFNP